MMTPSNGFAEASGPRAWRFDGDAGNAYADEWKDLFAAIRTGARVNEAARVAESTQSAIMGRIAAYTGADLSWDEALALSLDLRPPADLAFTARAQAPVAIPGSKTSGSS